jgi:hypothetical protein
MLANNTTTSSLPKTKQIIQRDILFTREYYIAMKMAFPKKARPLRVPLESLIAK